MTRIALVSTILAALAGSAAAAPRDVTAMPLAAGASADEAVSAATRADDKCLPRCTSEPVASSQIRPGTKLELRRTTSSVFGGGVFHVVIARGDRWFAGPEIFLLDDSCGMGKCADETIDRATIRRDGGIAWLTLDITFTLSHFEPKSTMSQHYQLVAACAVDREVPACAVPDVNRWRSTGATIAGDTVTFATVDNDGKPMDDAVHIVFPPAP